MCRDAVQCSLRRSLTGIDHGEEACAPTFSKQTGNLRSHFSEAGWKPSLPFAPQLTQREEPLFHQRNHWMRQVRGLFYPSLR